MINNINIRIKIASALLLLCSTGHAFAVSCVLLGVTRTIGSTLTDFKPEEINDAVKAVVEQESSLKWEALNLLLLKKTKNLKSAAACRAEQQTQQQLDLKRVSDIFTDRESIRKIIVLRLQEVFRKHKVFFDLAAPLSPLIVDQPKLQHALFADHEVSAGVYDYGDYVTSQFQVYYSKMDRAAFVVVTPLKKDWQIRKEKDKNVLTNMVRFVVPSLGLTYPDAHSSFSAREIAPQRIGIVPPDSAAAKLSAEELSQLFLGLEDWKQMKFWVWKDDATASKAHTVSYASYVGTPSDEMSGLVQDDLMTIGKSLIDGMFAVDLLLYHLKPAHILLRRDEMNRLVVMRINSTSDAVRSEGTELKPSIPSKDNADQLIITLATLNGWDRPSTTTILNELLSYAQEKEPKLTLTINKKDFIDRLQQQIGVFSDPKSKTYGPSADSPHLPVLPVRPAGAS